MSVKNSCMIFSIILLLIIYIIFIINTCMCIFFLLKCQTVLMHFNRCTYYTSYMQLHTCIYFKVFLIHLDMRKKILQVIIDQSYYYSLWYQWLFLRILKSLAMTGQWNSFCQLTTSGPILYSSHTVQHMVFIDMHHALLGKEVIYLFSIAESTSAYSYTYMYGG